MSEAGPSRFHFQSSLATGLGGVYAPPTRAIHMEDLDSAPPGVFLRLLLHETGHATFEQLLLDHRALHALWGSGEVARLLSRRQQIRAHLNLLFASQPPVAAADRRNAQYDDPAAVQVGQLTAEMEEVERQLTAADVSGQWEAMSADARSFYRAWLVLRRQQGRYLLGLDLGEKRSPGERQIYQAGTFQEFCAESFMHAATGDLAGHLHALQSDPSVPGPVLRAWSVAARILEKYRALIVGG